MYRIIIADDEPVMRKALLTLVDWQELGCEVVATCSSGIEAQSALVEHHPDILISDIKMPGQNGLELAEMIAKRAMPVKVILLTAFADFSFAQQAIRFGVTEYVTKTGSMEEIVAAVEKCKERLKIEASGTQTIGRTESFFRSVIDGSLYEPDALCAGADTCGLNLSKYTVISLELPPVAGKTLEKAGKLLQSEFPQAWLLSMGATRTYAVLCGKECNITARCEQLAEAFRTLTRQALYMGLSHTDKGAENLRMAFIQADIALEQAFFFPYRAVHSYAEDVQGNDDAGRDLSAHMGRFAEAIELGNERLCAQMLEDLFCLQSIGGSPEQVRGEGLLLINLCRTQLERAAIPMDSLDESVLWREQLQECRTFPEYKTMLHSFLGESCRAVARKLQTGGNVVQDARRYIEKNYHRPITLSEIAAATNVNPSYLSRVFKSKTGLNLVDTINRKRMDKAKTLLVAGQKKVYEVAAAVGVEDTTYFSHLFRKYTGMSPRDYQDNHNRRRDDDSDSINEDGL